jgi:hypothetical protein
MTRLEHGHGQEHVYVQRGDSNPYSSPMQIDYGHGGPHVYVIATMTRRAALEGEPDTYFHGTSVPNVTHILPATHHDEGVIYGETDPHYAYATHKLADAWDYAADAHAHADYHGKGDGRRPRVYEVRPMHGDRSHVEVDPNYDPVHNYRRDVNPGDRRSKVGWEVVREVKKLPKFLHDDFHHIAQVNRDDAAKATLDHGHGRVPHLYITSNRHVAVIEEPCDRCRGTGKHPAAGTTRLRDDPFDKLPCPGCGGGGVQRKAEWTPTNLSAHQQSARDIPDWSESKRALLGMARERTPGTKVWRGEIRHKDDLENPPSVGLHWSVDSDQIVTPAEEPPSGHHRVIWEAEIEHPDQAFDRSHPIWSGQHRSMDSESEVRFKPGAKVKVTRRYVHDNSTGNTTFVPHKWGRSDGAWQAHDMNSHVETAHKPTSDLIDYGDVGVHKQEKTAASAINVPPDYHRERPDTWGPDYHRYVAENPHAAAVGQAQEHLRLHVPAYETSLSDSETEAGESLRHMLRNGGHPRADEAFVTRHRDPRRASSNVVYDPDDREIPGVALHPSRWDYGTLAHEAAHILHHHEIDRKPNEATPDHVMHGDDFARHFQFTLGMVHKRAPEEFEAARTQALKRIHDAVESRREARAQDVVRPKGRSLTPLLLSRLAFIPTQRLFGPTYGLDHRLFDGDQLKDDVRRYIYETLADFWKAKHGCDWDEWAIVYLAGSEASEWTSEERVGNNDFDVLIGVDYDKFRGNHASREAGKTDQEITDELNNDFKRLNQQTVEAYIPIDGHVEGPFSNTWYVNPDSYDIRKIKPYAAYDVTHMRWAVKPPHLPKWDISQFPEGPALVAECQAVSAYVRAILNMPEPYRTQQGYALWHHLHSDRSRAFSDLGEGWYDPGNVIEKWLDQEGLWEQLVQIMVRVKAHPETMNAPPDWSNSPVIR